MILRSIRMLLCSTTHPSHEARGATCFWFPDPELLWNNDLDVPYFFVRDDVFWCACGWWRPTHIATWTWCSLQIPTVLCLLSCGECIWHSFAPLPMSPESRWLCIKNLTPCPVSSEPLCLHNLMRARSPSLQNSKVNCESANCSVTPDPRRDSLALTEIDQVSGNVNAQQLYLSDTLVFQVHTCRFFLLQTESNGVFRVGPCPPSSPQPHLYLENFPCCRRGMPPSPISDHQCPPPPPQCCLLPQTVSKYGTDWITWFDCWVGLWLCVLVIGTVCPRFWCYPLRTESIKYYYYLVLSSFFLGY